LRHGFHADLADDYRRAPLPTEYHGLPRPLLGYTGRIDDRLDFDILDALAERFSGGSLLLVGPVSPRISRDRIERLNLTNVHLLGVRPREALPAYLVHLDCCLMPYQKGEWANYGSPLKLWDYLYAGPPSVGSGYAALRDFPPPLVHFAEGPLEFCAAVHRALTEDGPRQAARRHEFARSNTWDHRAAQLHDVVMANTAVHHAGRSRGAGPSPPTV
jgi:glycosyltransferase involved in cell wall biosynthesis